MADQVQKLQESVDLLQERLSFLEDLVGQPGLENDPMHRLEQMEVMGSDRKGMDLVWDESDMGSTVFTHIGLQQRKIRELMTSIPIYDKFLNSLNELRYILQNDQSLQSLKTSGSVLEPLLEPLLLSKSYDYDTKLILIEESFDSISGTLNDLKEISLLENLCFSNISDKYLVTKSKEIENKKINNLLIQFILQVVNSCNNINIFINEHIKLISVVKNIVTELEMKRDNVAF